LGGETITVLEGDSTCIDSAAAQSAAEGLVSTYPNSTLGDQVFKHVCFHDDVGACITAPAPAIVRRRSNVVLQSAQWYS